MTPRCTDDGKLQTCNPTIGTYSDPMACPVGQTCIGTGCIMTVCQPNQLFCRDSQTVAKCDALGDNSTIVQQCTGNATCANGGCVSACNAADILKSFNGCQFYAVDMDNDSSNDMLENDIIVANSSQLTANVKVEVRQGASWQTLCSASVPPGMTHPFALTSSCDFTSTTFLDRHIEDSGLVQGGAYRVTSDAPIVAYYFNSDDKSGAASSSGSMVLLPRSTLGRKYYALNWPQPAANVGFDMMNRAAVDIVASQDNTTVTVHSSTNIIAGSGVPAMVAGDVHNFMLNEGDLLQLETLNPGDDVSGSFIEADRPVAVYTGVECLVNPTGGADCDHIEEQILPLVAWGKNYVAPRIAAQSTNCTGAGDPLVGCPASSWRIMASEANTQVTLSAPTGVTLTPPGPFMLGPGMVQEVVATGTVATAPGDFFIQGSKPILVLQLTGSETASVTVVPVEQFLPEYLFGVPDFFCTTLTVTRKAGTVVQLDGMPIADSLFNPVGGGFEVARLPVNQTQCGVGNSQGMVVSHTIRTPAGPDGHTNPAGIDLYGVDINCSYGYVGGLNITVINPVE
jgi:hypothetical protein